MVRKEITLVAVPNYQNQSYSKTLSLTVFRILLVVIIISIIGLGVAIFMTTRFYYQMLKINYLTRRNAQLENEYSKLQTLKERLVKLEEESQKIKNMLGVDKSPPKVDFLSLSESEMQAPTETTKSNKNLLPPELADQLKKEKVQYMPAQAPLVNYVISKGFDLNHTGIDLVAPLGTPVSATADGLIKEVGNDSIYGKYVLIKHGTDYTSFYGHLSRIVKTVGEKVTKGDYIGYLGATGQVSAPHLHFEISYKGEKVDPVKILHLKSS